jgi:hypothetical protein
MTLYIHISVSNSSGLTPVNLPTRWRQVTYKFTLLAWLFSIAFLFDLFSQYTDYVLLHSKSSSNTVLHNLITALHNSKTPQFRAPLAFATWPYAYAKHRMILMLWYWRFHFSYATFSPGLIFTHFAAPYEISLIRSNSLRMAAESFALLAYLFRMLYYLLTL